MGKACFGKVEVGFEEAWWWLLKEKMRVERKMTRELVLVDSIDGIWIRNGYEARRRRGYGSC